MVGYFTYTNNTTKRMVKNLHYMGFLVIYETVCFICFKGNHEIDGNGQHRYLDANQIDYSAANKFVVDDFYLEKITLNIIAAWYTIFCQIFLVIIFHKHSINRK